MIDSSRRRMRRRLLACSFAAFALAALATREFLSELLQREGRARIWPNESSS